MERKERESYPSDLTDEQWEEIAPLYTGMRNCTWSKRELTDAVLYLVDSGVNGDNCPTIFRRIQQYTVFIAAPGSVGCGIKFWSIL